MGGGPDFLRVAIESIGEQASPGEPGQGIVFMIAPTIQKHLGWFVARLPQPARR